MTKVIKFKKQVYIQSIEASKIWEHMNRDTNIVKEYNAMIPYSLELIKLRQLGLTELIKKRYKYVRAKGDDLLSTDKIYTDDVINIKFNYTVEPYEKKIEKLQKNLEYYESQLKEENDESRIEYLTKTIAERNAYIMKAEQEKDLDKWKSVTTTDLRQQLYENGFIVIDKNGKSTKYKLFKRSSSKSRKGECTFIKESLHKKMIKWSRLGFDIEKDSQVDLIALRAYESLVSSSIEDIINIDVNGILVIDDIKSKFNEEVKVIEVGNGGRLRVDKRPEDIENDIWDGQSLLDYNTYFKDKNYSFMLLRQHMFKSAAFAIDIEQFLLDNRPEGVSLEEWKLTDVFGNEIPANQVKMITTPNSLKFLKISYLMMREKSLSKYKELSNDKKLQVQAKMFERWKKIVSDEDMLFGICKHDKPSKLHKNKDGQTMQRLSYQMINSAPLNKEQVKELLKDEIKYVEQLQNNIDTFIDYLKETSNDMNINDLYIKLYKISPYIQFTQMFKNFRSSVINRYKKSLKSGNIQVTGDNLTMCSNPIEMLYSAINRFDGNAVEPITLIGNQVYTTQFDFDKDKKILLHRSPHTSPSNTLIVNNTYNKKIETYVKCSKNIIVVNSIKNNIMEQLSGCDFDSDFVNATDNKILLEAYESVKGNYPVCISKVEEKSSNAYKLNENDMSQADTKIGVSGKLIGQVANLGQLAMSTYYDLLSQNKTVEAEEVLKLIDKVCVLSTCVIDMAKKEFAINIKGEIKSIESKLKQYISNKKPLFFELVEADKIKKQLKKGEELKTEYTQFNCPMDWLLGFVMDSKLFKNTKQTTTYELIDLLDNTIDKNSANRNQVERLIEIAEEVENFFNKIQEKSLTEDEKMIKVSEFVDKIKNELQQMKIKKETIYKLLVDIHKKDSKSKLDKKYNRFIKLLFEINFAKFKSIFTKNLTEHKNKIA